MVATTTISLLLLLLPAFVDQCLGSRIHIMMNSDKKIVRITLGFDFVNMALKDVTELEITPEGRNVTKLDLILKSGNNAA
ncbi:U6 snRNA-associated Sm-like protein LSm5 [Fukomys damarensis]|uniref:U6 snRNA-associated Sm-like protein LSm5 n=1 Tax=Fukomys damarensis TaxID=885580 RepID=A0A091E5G0_FUKDA|nr:U6 snRNA-associated Sm-like protein LSm5 [Fukomys damarensis]